MMVIFFFEFIVDSIGRNDCFVVDNQIIKTLSLYIYIYLLCVIYIVCVCVGVCLIIIMKRSTITLLLSKLFDK